MNHENYGKDFILALFQFYVKPIPYLQQALKEIEPYFKKEKAIGIPIVINNENFFDKSEQERWSFLKQSILRKLDLLAEVVKKKKLDTDMELLKSDLTKVLSWFYNVVKWKNTNLVETFSDLDAITNILILIKSLVSLLS